MSVTEIVAKLKVNFVEYKFVVCLSDDASEDKELVEDSVVVSDTDVACWEK